MTSRKAILVILLLSLPTFYSAIGVCQTGNQTGTAEMVQSLSSSLADLALRVRPSVVQIRTFGYGSVEGQGPGTVASQEGTGSGVILDSEGFIVTNAHVVKGANRIEVWLGETSQQGGAPDGNSQKRSAAARLIGMDLETDIAVVKIDRSGLSPLKFLDSDTLRQGQIVMAIGSPLALENSVSMGVISSAERQLNPEDPAVYIQTDAPINPGNSGGPLIDVQGRLAGINTFILSQSGGSEGIGFAIPSNVIKRIYTELRKEGHVHHGHIGIRAIMITPSLAAGLQLPRDWGVIVEDVEPDGPSDQAGLQPGDLITSVDGATLRNLRHLLIAIDRHRVGETMQMSLQRGTEKIATKVVVQERADDPNRFMDMIRVSSNPIPRLGVLAINITDDVLKMLPELRKPAGVLVAARIAELQDSEDGLATGDLIIALNGNEVANIESLRKFLDGLQSGNPAVFQIQREDMLKYLVLNLP